MLGHFIFGLNSRIGIELMEEHRIVTHRTIKYDDPYPWTAFIFEPDYPDQFPADYLADNFCHLEDTGKMQFGETEREA